jgi:hypothetical protein
MSSPKGLLGSPLIRGASIAVLILFQLARYFANAELVGHGGLTRLISIATPSLRCFSGVALPSKLY